MRKTSLIFLMVFLSSLVQALDFDPFKGPKPIAVLIQTDPWLMVIGSDTPIVSIYDDGQIVFQKKMGHESILLHTQISSDSLVQITKRLRTFGDYAKLKSYYDLAPNVDDLPTTQIYLAIDEREIATQIYGLIVPDNGLPAFSALSVGGSPDTLPNLVKDLSTYLNSFNLADAKPWEPAFVELMISRFDNSIGSVPWPKEWPGLDSPNSRRRRQSYSIFLPGQDLAKVREFLKSLRDGESVEIAGHKWSVDMRYAFPGEPIWREAFRKTY